MKRGGPLRRRTPLRRTPLRACPKPNDQLREARFVVKYRNGGRCEVASPACPPGPHDGHHAHHVKSRARGGDHSPANLLYVCSAAHGWIHANPAEATRRGWLLTAHG